MSALHIGIMSGTSLDGIDAVVADVSGDRPVLVAHRHHALPPALRTELAALCCSGSDEIHRSSVAAVDLARLYAEAVTDTLAEAAVPASSIAAIGCHGQTIRHAPEHHYTVQLNAPALLAELTGICVVSDFRARDIAAGGQGAPLVPAFHAYMLGSGTQPRAALNLGGMSNLTLLAADQPVLGFDCGPANVLMDAWIEHTRGMRYDHDGMWAAQGTVDPALLERLMAHPFFATKPPKSCGREQFNLNWLRSLISPGTPPVDVQTTLTELTAQSVAAALRRARFAAEEIVVCGGGAFNSYLLRRLRAATDTLVRSTAEIGVAPDTVEAMAFAWLAHCALSREAGNIPAVTGARGPRILGAIWPA
ncbi:MAG: anhydro-N-acetylmuramic acid kinase [Gammaproteobacteria bacterium]|jgi:anhydro-N-acetylmuramic acid kinase|nr:anhydro-N-acetylmuramic acid kinase [Gammaproteobacteria bacterium]MBU0858191.1 anhydro-N-acetylmuramic acid kinase [Gammaproteobacteria bacterium]MBU1846567.1 anhydro-N-acetylmuramic acid kinase [Gammaproteobacteria bacterium]